MYLIQDNIGNYAEADDIGGAATAAQALLEDNLEAVQTVTITRRRDQEQIVKDFERIAANASKAAWGH